MLLININLFSNAGRELLNQVQEIHGAVLTKDKALPSLACRPCERKVKKAWNIKQQIAQTQHSACKRISFFGATSTKNTPYRCNACKTKPWI